MENKKTLILSIIGILVLVIAVVGVSFAMYSFTGTGSKTNTIQTGSITLNVDKAAGNSFTFDGAYSMSDSKALDQTDNSATVGVSANWGGTAPITIKYDLGIEVVQAGATLTEDYVKVALLDSSNKVLVGSEKGTTNLTGGVTIGSLKNVAAPNGYITQYGLAGGTLTNSGTTDTYTIKAWVSDAYDLAVDPAKSTTDNQGNLTTDGLHKKETKSETFKFKIVVQAVQV